MLNSALFAYDPLLEDITADIGGQRISATQNRNAPAVRQIQKALLLWDPNCLPLFGADGDYGNETAKAVHRFKVVELGVPEAQVVDDIGPLTVQRLDQIAFAREQSAAEAVRMAQLDQWLGPVLSGVSSSVSSSDIKIHTSGTEAFLALHAALQTCVDDRAIVVISEWDFDPNCPIAPGVTIGSALQAAAGRGTKVRALFNSFPVIHIPLVGDWRPLPGDNTGAVAFVNGLPNGAAIHDAKVLHHTAASVGLPIPEVNVQLGVHHMKAWVVWTGERLTAWCGGIDINSNRVGPNALHDVQAELNGPAAANVYGILRQRWQDHPTRPSGVDLPALVPSPATGSHRARVITTLGNPTQFAGLNTAPYSFAPTGSKAIRQLISHLMGQAQNFIYVEDQYFVDESVGRELATHMSRLKALILLICDSNSVNGELHQAFARRRAVFAHLAPHAAKVAVVIRNNRFVHAKTWIFDDTIAVVSSANVNRRGFEHDSEIGVAFGDVRGLGTARELRERLWALHLGPNAPAIGSDPIAALPTWQSPPAGAPISKYDPAAGTDGTPIPVPANTFLSNDQFWEIVDPRCP